MAGTGRDDSQPSVSRIVAGLEARLGIKLLQRTTRRVTPSARVMFYFGEAAQAARGLDSLHGVLRVVMSGAFGTREVIPRLPGFLACHPPLKVEFVISDRTDDLVAERADMVPRIVTITVTRRRTRSFANDGNRPY